MPGPITPQPVPFTVTFDDYDVQSEDGAERMTALNIHTPTGTFTVMAAPDELVKLGVLVINAAKASKAAAPGRLVVPDTQAVSDITNGHHKHG